MLGHGRKQVLSVAVTVAAVYYDDSHWGRIGGFVGGFY